MQYSELINDYLDNVQLSSVKEDMLFQALAHDQDLRLEFRSLLLVRQAVRKDHRAYVPPMASVNTVFAKLGYTAPASAGALGGMASVKSALLSKLSLSTANIVSALVGAILASSLLLTFGGGGSGFADVGGGPDSNTGPGSTEALPPLAAVQFQEQDEHSASASAATPPAVQSVPEPVHSAANRAAAPPPARRAQHESSDARSIDNFAYAQPTVQHENNAVDSPTAADATASSSTAVAHTEPKDPSLALVPASPLAESMNALSVRPSQSSSSSYGRRIALPDGLMGADYFGAVSSLQTTFEVRNLQMFHVPGGTVPVNGNQGPVDFALHFRYDLTPNSAIVFEAGREAFFQEFDEVSNDWRYEYRQQPQMWWFSAGYRHSFFNNAVVQPFLQGSLGIAQGGAMGRLLAGGRYDLSESAYVNLAVESSMLLYTHGGSMFRSHNLGLSYGLGFTF